MHLQPQCLCLRKVQPSCTACLRCKARACGLQVVNLIKGQILLNDVERVMPDTASLSPARRNLGGRRAALR